MDHPAAAQALTKHGTANESKETIADIFANIRSWIPSTNVRSRQVLIGVGVAALSVGCGFGGYLLYQRYRAKCEKDALSQILGMNIELNKAREASNASKDSPPEGILILHQCPRGRRAPSIAPFPLKLETFLRVHNIKYQTDFHSDGPQNPETPWVTLNLEDVSDSQNCLEFVCAHYGLDPDAHVPEHLKPIGLAFNHMLENHLYWGIALWRWVYDGARHLNDIQLLPPKTMGLIPNVCRTVEQAAWFHGIGKKKPGDVVDSILADMQSLSAFLGDKQYFLHEKLPSELDCTAFALLAQMLWCMDDSPYHRALLEEYTNLADFCQRMREKYWPDWNQSLNNEEVLDTDSNPVIA